ncbi:hypothetical protein C3489_35320 [Streptomyces sp. Ru71]|uniref:hypothetical protein n=1 Tax=Streptomyces sp. Ru71 TaxID=2080746 RepID=UPI000CDE3D0C|nr:hypothetical protein [Streptomyces sp. Ru71]POX44945.1 hypothetical protein C3489_35320 [Streptomyces sp. Ru71]
MTRTTTRVGGGRGTGARRTMTAAARAAAKRAERGREEAGAERAERGQDEAAGASPAARPPAGRTLVVEAPKDGWQDPPEPGTTEDDDAERDGTGDARAAGSSPRRRRLLTALLCLLLVAGLVAAGLLGWRCRQGTRAEEARRQALVAAEQAVPVVLSYDYRRLPKDFAAARARLTGTFEKEYDKTTAGVVGPTARKYHAVVKATVAHPADGGTPAASVVSASPDRVTVLLFVNQVTRSTQVTGSRLDLNRVRLTMTRTSAGWKVSGVDAL